IDDVVVFHALGREHLRRIVDLQLALLGKRLTERRVTLSLTDAARDWLGEVGYDPVYGARPLKRALQAHVLNPLARALLEGRVGPGDHILVERQADGLHFERSPTSSHPATPQPA
ncbi:MAG: type VI secretion system ATPase TssH, partial [Candidatus Sericytochromatia bacterium]|nr:type VI secretion system ATPase TssH [Candidatus Sericytochromatia bacterium]